MAAAGLAGALLAGTAAGWDVRAEFRDRPTADAARLTEELAALCRTARLRG